MNAVFVRTCPGPNDKVGIVVRKIHLRASDASIESDWDPAASYPEIHCLPTAPQKAVVEEEAGVSGRGFLASFSSSSPLGDVSVFSEDGQSSVSWAVAFVSA